MDNNQKNYSSSQKVLLFISLLRKNGKMKAKELIKHMGLKNTRNITLYKNGAIELGYEIKSSYGHNGGYEIIEKRLDNKELDFIKSKIGNLELYEKIVGINNRI